MSLWWIAVLVAALVATHRIELRCAVEGKETPACLLGFETFCAVRLVLELFSRL